MPKRRAQEDGDSQIAVEKRSRTQKPRLWRVILHNDDFTTMEFVIEVLVVVFHKRSAEAVELMLEVHERGACLAGVYTREVAEMKVETVEQMARAAECPFLATMEPEGGAGDGTDDKREDLR
jgi:ATP-dependent Clp protease adaptor protein ClpS